MKQFNTFGIVASSLVAGSLCAALMSGCGSTAANAYFDQDAGEDVPSAVTDVGENGGESSSPDSGSASASDADYRADASAYPSITSFEAKTLDGGTFTQADLAKADVTLINVWGTFCGFCVEEMPEIASWAQKLPENVQVITICTDYDADPQAAKDILAKAGFTGTTLVSGDGDLKDLIDAVMFLPTTIVVNGEGEVVGDVLESMAHNVEKTFTEMVNQGLQEQGKPTISL